MIKIYLPITQPTCEKCFNPSELEILDCCPFSNKGISSLNLQKGVNMQNKVYDIVTGGERVICFFILHTLLYMLLHRCTIKLLISTCHACVNKCHAMKILFHPELNCKTTCNFPSMNTIKQNIFKNEME